MIKKYLNICIYSFCIFLLIIFQISCTKNEIINGYNDLIVNSPSLLWGSSIEELKSKYSNIEEYENYCFLENKQNRKILERLFNYYENKLFMVNVCYGKYSKYELEILKKQLEKNYGIENIEDNGTIEIWYIKNNENNKIVFTINKIQNNLVNCSYINPYVNPYYDKNILLE